MVETARRHVVRCTAPCRLPPTQIDLMTGGGGSFALSMCAVAIHRNARAIAPNTISTAAKAIVNASIKSVSISDLYIVSPLCGESLKGLRCEMDKAAPRLKLASFGNLRGRTRGKFVIATIARTITNCSSRYIKELEISRSHDVKSAWFGFRNGPVCAFSV
jgi:hypothetical protein